MALEGVGALSFDHEGLRPLLFRSRGSLTSSPLRGGLRDRLEDASESDPELDRELEESLSLSDWVSESESASDWEFVFPLQIQGLLSTTKGCVG
jgi:hypothetical protein